MSVIIRPPNREGPPLQTDAIVLDIDDTLYLERDYVRSGFAAVGTWAADELGISDFAARAWSLFQAGARGHIFDEVLKACDQQPDSSLVAEMVVRYRAHTPTIELAADARRALNQWRGSAALAVVTDGPHASQEAKAAALTLEAWIPFIVFTATLGQGKGKPHPAAFELVQDRLGVSSRQCAYIADNPHKDFIAPRQLGWHTIRVRRRHGLHAGVASGADVDIEVESLEPVTASPRVGAVGVEGNGTL